MDNKTYRFTAGVNKKMIVLNFEGILPSGPTRTAIMYLLIAFAKRSIDDIDKFKAFIGDLVSTDGGTVVSSDVTIQDFELQYVFDLRDAAEHMEHVFANEDYVVISCLDGSDSNRYSAIVSSFITDDFDKRQLRMAVQRTDIGKNTNQFDFIFSNAYPRGKVEWPDISVESVYMPVIPYMTSADNLVAVLNELFDVSSMCGGVSRVERILNKL